MCQDTESIPVRLIVGSDVWEVRALRGACVLEGTRFPMFVDEEARTVTLYEGASDGDVGWAFLRAINDSLARTPERPRVVRIEVSPGNWRYTCPHCGRSYSRMGEPLLKHLFSHRLSEEEVSAMTAFPIRHEPYRGPSEIPAA